MKLPAEPCAVPFGRLEKSVTRGQAGHVNTALADFFDLKGQNHEELFSGVTHAWEVLPRIGDYLKANLRNGSKAKLIGAPVIGENACWLCRAEQPVKTVVDVLGNVFYNRS